MVQSQRRWHRVVELASSFPRLALVLFFCYLIALCGWAVQRSSAEPIATDLFALVAAADEDPVRDAAVERMRHRSDQQQTWLVSHPHRDAAFAAARSLAGVLFDSHLYSSMGTPGQESNLTSAADYYDHYTHQLIDDTTLALIREGNTAALVDRAVRAMYAGPFALPLADIEGDPFLIAAYFLNQLLHLPEPLQIDRGLVALHHHGQWTYLVPARLARSAFDFGYQTRLAGFAALMIPALEQHTGATITSVGAVDFAVANRGVALREASLIGSASLLLITLLLLVTFRSLRPFFAIVLTVTTGVAGGLLICLIVFESVHVLTLVGGSSLIGISVDYSFHLLSDGYRESDRRWSVDQGLKSVLPPVLLGLSTTTVGFLGLYASGFRGLQEIAVFSAGGLLTAFLGLILTYSWMLQRWRPGRRPQILHTAQWWTRIWRPGRRGMMAVAIGVVAVLAVAPQIRVDNDVRLLSAQTRQLEALAERAATLSGSMVDSRFILVRADSVEALLQREESLRGTLDNLRNDGAISHFDQLSRYVPSGRRQREALAVHHSLCTGPDPAITRLVARVSLTEQAARQYCQALPDAAALRTIELEDWLDSSVGVAARHLWLGPTGDGVASVVSLGGVRDVARWSEVLAGLEGVTAVDVVADVSGVFAEYVSNAIRGLSIAVVLVTLLMVLRFGIVEGMTLVLVPVLSGALSLLTLSLLEASINLFHIVGFALILGTGMDYALFLKSGRGRPQATLAVFLAALTTECAFGLLALSQVGAIHDFGLTVALGTAFSFLLAPMVVQSAPIPAAGPAP